MKRGFSTNSFIFEYPQGKYRKDIYKDKPWYGKYVCRVIKGPSVIENRGAGRGYLIINRNKLARMRFSLMYFDEMPNLNDIIYVNGQRCKILFFDMIPYMMRKGAIDLYDVIVGDEDFDITKSPVFMRIVGMYPKV